MTRETPGAIARPPPQRHDRAFRQPTGRRALALLHHDVNVDDIGLRAYAAIVAGDWNAVRPFLHPYLHWADSNGRTFRGRSRVLAMLQQAAQSPAEAQSIELRDGQIYRWHG